MCFLHHRPGLEEYGEVPDSEPVPRSYPRLKWAVPVDAAELGASLETFEALSPPIEMLRLCHRFGRAPLSTMPQELLDLIISMLYRSTREVTVKRWDKNFRCFQGRCTAAVHLDMDDNEIERVWSGIAHNQEDACGDCHRHDDGFDLADYGVEKKRELVEQYINKDGDWAFDSINEAHEESREEWLDMLCLCKLRALQCPMLKTFLPFQEILKSHFGLEATFLHETLSRNMIKFLPDVFGPSSIGYFTSCFLVLPKNLTAKVVSQKRAEEHDNQAFLKEDIHLAFHQRIDLKDLGIGEKEKSSFTRILRVLELDPSFHLTELETSLASSTGEDALSKISKYRLKGWPLVSSSSIDERKRRLKTYLERKHQEVGKQQWPQLMLMAASDTVGPILSSG